MIVGARESRVYEIEYLQKLRAMIKNVSNIEVHDVTTDVEQFFQMADCLIITSLNEGGVVCCSLYLPCVLLCCCVVVLLCLL